jgi:hypothetical protein
MLLLLRKTQRKWCFNFRKSKPKLNGRIFLFWICPLGYSAIGGQTLNHMAESI